MHPYIFRTVLCFVGLTLLSSCARRNLAYLSDLSGKGEYAQKAVEVTEAKIRPDDLLSISVTSLNAEANLLFNRGEIISTGNNTNYGSSSMNYNTSSIYREGYLVDKWGYIDFPVLGKLQLGGLTKAQAKDTLKVKLQKVLKEPIVNIRYLNYKITVVGEVNRPATFTIPSENINIIEALGMAGDMTIYGRRENVLVMRTEDGIQKIVRMNLNSKEIINSPYFYLMPNDVVYVEPHRMKEVQAGTNTNFIAIAGSALSILALVVMRFF